MRIVKTSLIKLKWAGEIMKTLRIILCVVIIFGLCFPVLGALNCNVSKTRHVHSLTKFQYDIDDKVLTFMKEGIDSSLVVELPENAKIESAAVDIEGRIISLCDNTTANFTNTINNQAWEDETNQEYPITSSPSKFMSKSFSVNDYNEVKALDRNNKSTIGGVSSSGYPVQLFEFNLSSFAIIKFDVFWKGAYFSWNSGSTDGMNVSIWNESGNTWEVIGGYYQPWIGIGLSAFFFGAQQTQWIISIPHQNCFM